MEQPSSSNPWHGLCDLVATESPYGQPTLVKTDVKLTESDFAKLLAARAAASAAVAAGMSITENAVIVGPATDKKLGPQKEGPASDNCAGQESKKTIFEDEALVEKITNQPQVCSWWTFDGTAHRVVKAIRVPYTLDVPAGAYQSPEYKADPQATGERTEYLLIGFVGYETP